MTYQLYNRLGSGGFVVEAALTLAQAPFELITLDSPTQRVSSDLTKEFETVTHIVPMLSLDNSYNADDLRKFDEQIQKLTGESNIEYVVEPKFDGGSIAITTREIS